MFRAHAVSGVICLHIGKKKIGNRKYFSLYFFWGRDVGFLGGSVHSKQLGWMVSVINNKQSIPYNQHRPEFQTHK